MFHISSSFWKFIFGVFSLDFEPEVSLAFYLLAHKVGTVFVYNYWMGSFAEILQLYPIKKTVIA